MTMARRVGVWLLGVVVVGVGSAQAQNTTTRVNVTSTGAQSTGFATEPFVSGNGRFVVFLTASALVVGDTNGMHDVYLHDRQTGITERASVGAGGQQANGPSDGPSISSDGRYVAFSSEATNLVSGDSNGALDVFVRDRQLGTTMRASMAPSGAGGPGSVQANGPSYFSEISANGRHVTYASNATNLAGNDTNNQQDIFVTDLQTLIVTRVSVATGGAQSDEVSYRPAISADGRIVVYNSLASTLVSGDTNGATDVFVRDVQAATTTRVSVGSAGVQGNGASYEGDISADGRFVSFTSDATNFDPGVSGVFVYDRLGGTTTSVATTASTIFSFRPGDASLDETGRYLCFTQRLPASTFAEVFLIDRQTQTRTKVSIANNGDAPNDAAGNCSISRDGTIVAFLSTSTNLVAGDTNGVTDIFVRTLLPEMAVDKTSLKFTAVTNGATFVTQTAAQLVRLTQSGNSVATWSVTSNQPWLQVSPASGSGSGTLSISVQATSGLPASGTVTGQIFVSLVGAVNTLPGIPVTLTLTPNGTTVGPFGTVDTPIDNRTGVTGAVPFTGWALDDVEVTRVSICRAAVAPEVAPFDPNCGGAAEIFIGFAVFIDGARPDVAGTFSTYPLHTRGGWGFMVLTNFLPNQGNGTYQFTMRAQDREGNWFVAGRRTMTCANASATLPFGNIDTPLQGGTASGNSFINFGWALTPLPKTIPTNGSTISVLVDGVSIGTADYNHARPDIQALFPGFNNTNGAVGFRIFDTTQLTNGLHTISWVVSDDAGATEGIGSRFFTVSNGVGGVTAAMTSARSQIDVDALPLDTSPLAGRRGWDLEAPYGLFAAGATGVTVIRSEEVNRVELLLGEGEHTGYLRTSRGLEPLPIGSRIDRITNVFTWAPGVGFVGRYDFVFVRSNDGAAVSRREVRIVLHPKGRGAVGPQVVVDAPRPHAVVEQPFMVGGWAIDLDAPEGTGVSTLHAWAFPASGGAPVFLGATAYGGARPDVSAVHGDRFKDSGFGLIVQDLTVGNYDLALFAWSTETAGFVAPTIHRVHVTR